MSSPGLPTASRTTPRFDPRACVMQLQLSPEFLDSKSDALAGIFPIDAVQLANLLAKRPRLLLRAPTGIALTMVSLAKTLDTPVYDVAIMLAGAVVVADARAPGCSEFPATPGILGVSSENIAARWALLSQLTEQHAPWRQQLASLSLPSLGRCLVASPATISRLDLVVKSNTTSVPAFLKFKKIISMSSVAFNHAKGNASQPNQGRAPQAEQSGRDYGGRDYATKQSGNSSGGGSNGSSGGGSYGRSADSGGSNLNSSSAGNERRDQAGGGYNGGRDGSSSSSAAPGMDTRGGVGAVTKLLERPSFTKSDEQAKGSAVGAAESN
ncbi:MAG: hypothetical protein WDW36_004191 [Sanguina aurantia]